MFVGLLLRDFELKQQTKTAIAVHKSKTSAHSVVFFEYKRIMAVYDEKRKYIEIEFPDKK